MKALKTGLIGLAFGVAAALVMLAPEASAQSSCVTCPSGANTLPSRLLRRASRQADALPLPEGVRPPGLSAWAGRR